MPEITEQIAAYTDMLERRSRSRAEADESPAFPDDLGVLPFPIDAIARPAEPASPTRFRTGLVAGIAASLVLFTVVRGMVAGSDEGRDDTFTELAQDAATDDTSEMTTAALLDADPTRVGAIVQDAIRTGEPSLESLYAADVVFTVDSVDVTNGFERLTTADQWTAGFVEPTFSTCAPESPDVVVCPVTWTFDAADDAVLPPVRTFERLTLADGVIVAHEVTRAANPALATALQTYRHWLVLTDSPAAVVFNPEGSIELTPATAQQHASLLDAFFDDLDDHERLAEAANAHLAQGGPEFSSDIFESSIALELGGTSVAVPLGDLDYVIPGYMEFRIESCSVAVEKASYTCSVRTTYAPLGGVTEGSARFTMTVDEGRISAIDVVRLASANHPSEYAGYRAWVAENYPAEFDELFPDGSSVPYLYLVTRRHVVLAEEYQASLQE